MFALVALAACGNSPTSSTASPHPSPAASPAPAGPTGPPLAVATAVGDPGLGGTINLTDATCFEPRTDGPVIYMSGQAAGQPQNGVSTIITIRATSVTVKEATGSSTSYAERDFTGTGVTSFNARTGAKVDSTLTEEANPGTSRGTIGVLKSLKLAVDCAGQDPGSATITITGDTDNGAFGGPLTSVHVTCTTMPTGTAVFIHGLVQIGSSTSLAVLSVQAPGANFAATVADNGAFYITHDTTVASTTATGAHYSGDIPASAPGGKKVHVTGDATCGSSTAVAH